MFKVLIAEDETFIRKSLICHMDWAGLNCTVVGETGSGTAAIELLQSLKPDIVISDIHLEGQSGFEICEYIHRSKLTVKPVLITGYGDLNYAKAAIKWNAVDFILKPIDPEELEAAVRKATEQIAAERRRLDDMIALQAVVEESLPLLRDKFFLQLASDNVSDRNELEQNMAFFHIAYASYFVFALEIDEYKHFLESHPPLERQAYEVALRDVCLDEMELHEPAYYLDFAPNCHLIIASGHSCQDPVETAEDIQQRLHDRYGLSVSIGISGVRTDLHRLSEAVEEAKHALGHKFYSGNRSVIPVSDIRDPERGRTVSLFPHYLAIAKAAAVGDKQAAIGQFGSMWSLIECELDEEGIKHTVIEFIAVAQMVVRGENVQLDETAFEPNVYGLISRQSTIREVREAAQAMLLSLAERVSQKISSRNRTVVDKLLDHLKAHYDREITLQELGEIAFMNPKYVCRLLKQETGDNFTTLLTSIRVQKAKELMDREEYKVYEVARMVGISDSRYFSQMFKKHAGMTPVEYRNKFAAPDR